MNRIRFRYGWILVLLSLATLALGKDGAGQAGDTEPSIEYALAIDGKDVAIMPGRPVRVTIAGKEVTLKLTEKPDRLFTAEGLSFRYPVGDGFDVDKSTPGVTQWKFNGNHNTLILTGMPGEVDSTNLLSQTIEELAKKFGEQNVKRSKGQVMLGGKQYSCGDLHVSLLESKLRERVVVLSSKGGVFLLITQDTLNGDGSDSEESKEVLKLLERTLKVD